jgi:hypothetical protein
LCDSWIEAPFLRKKTLSAFGYIGVSGVSRRRGTHIKTANIKGDDFPSILSSCLLAIYKSKFAIES